MSGQFITNQEVFLEEIINKILPSTESVYFLVGYFYFSGFYGIYEELKGKNIKILVGKEIEIDFNNAIREILSYDNTNEYSSIKNIRNKYYKSIIDLCSQTNYFEDEKNAKAFKLFIEKIKNGTLEIRKTKIPNHSKLYIFKNLESHSQGGSFPGTIITGSSNLTASGLKQQSEINVIFRDKPIYIEAKELFDQIWNDSDNLLNKDNFNEFEKEVYKKIWINDILPEPFSMFIKVLIEYFTIGKDDIKYPAEITNNKFFNVKYQIDAIKKGYTIIKKHSGVIIADVVGLGKSIIASVIAFNMQIKTIIIAPPHLTTQWEDYRKFFGFDAYVFSSGKIIEALKTERDLGNQEKLIIIDEGHKYRNEKTNDYGYLHQLCQGNKIIILSATPFNNEPKDIFSMIKLFQIPSKSTLQHIDNLNFQLKEAINDYKLLKKETKQKENKPVDINNKILNISNRIRRIIEPLVIRRSRIDLNEIEEYKKDLENQNISIPTVHDPELLEYELGSLSEIYINTIEKIAPQSDKIKGFSAVRYTPLLYVKKEFLKEVLSNFSYSIEEENLFRNTQEQLAKFMRRLLVRRFESSIHSFKISLNNMINSCEIIKEWYENLGRIPIYKKGQLPNVDDLLESLGDSDEPIDVFLSKELEKEIEKGLNIIEADKLEPEYIEDLNSDIKLLKEIKNKWENIEDDPKLMSFEKIIKDQLNKDKNRKIVVFTEFSDTADYLEEKIKNIRLFKYHSKVSNQTNKRTIKENFDAGLESEEQKNDYDVLIATDAISEGYNLHRAGTIFNYDIPYNPTRVIQRVGRINRINKKVFDELYIYNFFPTATGEKDINIKHISNFKFEMINAVLGEDTKVITSETELKNYFSDKYKSEKAIEEERSWDIKYKNILYNLEINNPDKIEEAKMIPDRKRIQRSIKKDHKGILVFAKKGDEIIFKICNEINGEIKSLSFEEGIKLFEADISEKVKPVSNNFQEHFDYIRKNLFTKKTKVALEKGTIEAIEKIRIISKSDEIINKLSKNHSDIKSYFNDLLFVLKELDYLPEIYEKKIREININKIDEIKNLISQIPHIYLSGIIEKSKKVNNEREYLVLIEELV